MLYFSLALNAVLGVTLVALCRPRANFTVTAIAATVAAFWPIDSRAAFLLLPYLGWVGFAAVLNAVLWRMNCA